MSTSLRWLLALPALILLGLIAGRGIAEATLRQEALLGAAVAAFEASAMPTGEPDVDAFGRMIELIETVRSHERQERILGPAHRPGREERELSLLASFGVGPIEPDERVRSWRWERPIAPLPTGQPRELQAYLIVVEAEERFVYHGHVEIVIGGRSITQKTGLSGGVGPAEMDRDDRRELVATVAGGVGGAAAWLLIALVAARVARRKAGGVIS